MQVEAETSTSDSAPEQQAPATGTGKKGRVDAATLIAELEAREHEKPATTPTPAAKPPEPEEGVEAKDDAEADADAEDVEPEEGEADETAALDPATDKRLAGAQRAERQFRERMAKERATFDGERATFVKEWQPKVEAAEKFESLRGRARYAPDAVLEALGLGPEDWEPTARLLYARSQAGSKDPRNREAADRLMREREATDKLSANERRIAELEKRLETQATEAKTKAAVDGYLDQVTKAATAADKAPLVKRMLEKTPTKARQKLHELAVEMAEETGDAPSAGDVIARLEKRRRAELEEDGIDPATVLGELVTPANGANGKKPPSKTLAKNGGGPTTPREKPLSRDELFADLQRDLEANKLDS